MDEDLHNIEDLFKSALDDNAEMPSAKVWEAIDNRLDKDIVIIIKRKYNILKRLSLLLLLLLTSLGIYELNTLRINNHLVKTKDSVANKTVAYENKNENKESANKNIIISKRQLRSKDIKNNTTLNLIPANNSQMKYDYSFIHDKQHQKNYTYSTFKLPLSPDEPVIPHGARTIV